MRLEDFMYTRDKLIRCGYNVMSQEGFGIKLSKYDYEHDIVLMLHSLDRYSIKIWNGARWIDYTDVNKLVEDYELTQKF